MNEKKESVEKVLKKWLVVISRSTRATINRLTQCLLNDVKYGHVGLNSLVYRMMNELGELTFIAPEALSASIGMYYMMNYMSFKVHGHLICESLAYYTCLLYVDVDYTLDSSLYNKEAYTHEVLEFLTRDKECIDSGKPLMDDGNVRRYVWYRKLIQYNPSLINPILELFRAEIQSHKIQRVGASFEELLAVTKHKSVTTNLLLCAILKIDNVEYIEAFSHAGYISQLLDDMYDLENDRRDNIETLATYDLRTNGTLDNTFSLVVTEIGKMRCELNELRMAFLTFLVYIPTKSKVLSSEFLHMIDPYILVDARMLE